MSDLLILRADARALPLAAESVDCIVTSPPYWGLRDYAHPGQIGLERTPQEYVETMRAVFRECWRVLKPAGTCWLNLGDCYGIGPMTQPNRMPLPGLKPKDLVGIPWRVAFALQAAGWWLRSDIIWEKPNPMPESVQDRPTRAHEYLFLLAKAERYFYDAAAIAEPTTARVQSSYGDPAVQRYGGNSLGPGLPSHRGLHRGFDERRDTPGQRPRRSGNKERKVAAAGERQRTNTHLGSSVPWEDRNGLRNKRDVWRIATQPYPGAHFATFPEDLVRPCILAGCPAGGTILDPFAGTGTVGQVAIQLGRRAVLCDLGYQDQAKRRTSECQREIGL